MNDLVGAEMTEAGATPRHGTAPPFWECLGARFQLWSAEALTRRVVEWGSEPGRRALVGNVNIHAAALMRRVPEMREFNRLADAVHVDGMGMAFLARLCGVPAKRHHRVTYVDWIEPLLRAAAAAGLRVYFLGGRPAVAERAAEILRAKSPGLQMEVSGGYFDARPGSVENQRVLEEIRSVAPGLLLVGMGMPRQEAWILENLDGLDAGAILDVGACMDFVAGAVKTPPRWVGRLGLEWLVRLVHEPRRLGRRYLLEPWTLLGPALWAILTRRSRRPINGEIPGVERSEVDGD